ncbi:MAG: hypothetical protein LBI03_03490 [Clostridiales bacterium]|jgi:hypothetical protein|nr:hypothetical protein [Clostridiales bacterium]
MLDTRVSNEAIRKPITTDFQTSLFIKQVEKVEDAWRIGGGKMSLKNKAGGGSRGFLARCGTKILEE